MELWARNCPLILPKFRLPRKFRDLLHAANLRHVQLIHVYKINTHILRSVRLLLCVCTDEEMNIPLYEVQNIEYLRSSGCEEVQVLRPPPLQWVQGFFPGEKRPEPDDDSSSPISEIENQYV